MHPGIHGFLLVSSTFVLVHTTTISGPALLKNLIMTLSCFRKQYHYTVFKLRPSMAYPAVPLVSTPGWPFHLNLLYSLLSLYIFSCLPPLLGLCFLLSLGITTFFSFEYDSSSHFFPFFAWLSPITHSSGLPVSYFLIFPKLTCVEHLLYDSRVVSRLYRLLNFIPLQDPRRWEQLFSLYICRNLRCSYMDSKWYILNSNSSVLSSEFCL